VEVKKMPQIREGTKVYKRFPGAALYLCVLVAKVIAKLKTEIIPFEKQKSSRETC
jgi:hypothetical protein